MTTFPLRTQVLRWNLDSEASLEGLAGQAQAPEGVAHAPSACCLPHSAGHCPVHGLLLISDGRNLGSLRCTGASVTHLPSKELLQIH